MAFDGFTTAALTKELQNRLVGGRIYRIVEPDQDELILTIKPMIEKGGGTVRLYLCADPSLPLAYLTDTSRPAPESAPAFCMLLRKYLQNGKITAVTQPGMERIIRFEVEHLNEMGDLCRHTLLIELMGRHSNLIFVDEDGTIIDAIKHVSQMVSSVREVLPGRPYFIPQTQNKKDPLAETEEGFLAGLRQDNLSPSDHLVHTYTGFSNFIAAEIEYRMHPQARCSCSELTEADALRFYKAFKEAMDCVRSGQFTPAVYYEPAGRDHPRRIIDYSVLPMTMEDGMESVRYPGVSSLLESFYAEKNAQTRIRQKSADLRHIVQTILERDVHKYDEQSRQLENTKKRDKYKLYGELLNAYGYLVQPGVSSCTVENYYNGNAPITIPMDPTLSAQDNAKHYFERYTKLKRTQEALEPLMQKVSREIDHLRSIKVSLDLSTQEGDLAQIRQELIDSGYIRRNPSAKRKGSRRPVQSRPLHYISSDGYDILVGKNNTQNDELTFRIAAPTDIWFHANDIPGSHVILRTNGKTFEQIPDRAFEEAASLAAYYSSGRTRGKVEVDYTQRRNIRKPGGGAPGFVIYHTNYSIIAGTDISGLKRVEEHQ